MPERWQLAARAEANERKCSRVMLLRHPCCCRCRSDAEPGEAWEAEAWEPQRSGVAPAERFRGNGVADQREAGQLGQSAESPRQRVQQLAANAASLGSTARPGEHGTATANRFRRQPVAYAAKHANPMCSGSAATSRQHSRERSLQKDRERT